VLEPGLSIAAALAIFAVAIAAGIFAAMLGLGGGVILVPVLTLVFHVPIHEAYGASFVAVIATSSAGAATFVRDGYADVRLGMLLGAVTSAGGFAGALLASSFSPRVLAVVFGAVLLAVGVAMLRDPSHDAPVEAPPVEPSPRPVFAMDGGYHDGLLRREVKYAVRRLPWGLSGGFLAGNLSGLMGGGGGIVAVPLMNLVMCVPLKAAVATSNFLMGITVVSATLVWRAHGWIDPLVTAPAVLGVLIGAQLGSRLTVALPAVVLRRALFVVLLVVAAQMFLRAVRGGA